MASRNIATGEVTSPSTGPTIAPFVVPYWGRSRSKLTADSCTSVASSSSTIALSCCVDRSRPRKSASSSLSDADMVRVGCGEMGKVSKDEGNPQSSPWGFMRVRHAGSADGEPTAPRLASAGEAGEGENVRPAPRPAFPGLSRSFTGAIGSPQRCVRFSARWFRRWTKDSQR